MAWTRIVVVGSSGSGKSRIAGQLAEHYGFPLLELDSVHWQADWQPMPREEFRGAVRSFIENNERWVIDGSYLSHVGDIVWGAADSVVWLDLPRWRVMTQIVRRSLRRGLLGETLWNGNREDWRKLLSLDPEKNNLLWAWEQHRGYRTSQLARTADPQWAQLVVARLRSRGDVARWLAEIGER